VVRVKEGGVRVLQITFESEIETRNEEMREKESQRGKDAPPSKEF
jgi:hypothetical protein